MEEEIINKFEKFKWTKESTRKTTIHRYYDFAEVISHQPVKDITFLKSAHVVNTYFNGEVNQYHEKSEWEKAKENVMNLLKRRDILKFLKKNMFSAQKNITDWIRNKIYKKDISKCSNGEILALLKERRKRYLCLVNWQWFGFIGKFCIEEAVMELLKDYTKDTEEAVKIVFANENPVHIIQEGIETKKIALIAKKGNKKKLDKMLMKHLDRFIAVNMYDETYQEMTLHSLEDRINKLKKKEGLEEEIGKLKKKFWLNKKNYQELIKKYKFFKKNRELLDLAHKFSEFNEIRNYYRGLCSFYSRGFFEQIAKRLGLTLKEILCYCDEEIILALEGKMKLKKKEAKERYKKSVLVYDEDSFYFYTGEEAEKLIEKLELNPKNTNELSGQIACKGKKVIGKVKIINSTYDMHKLVRGDILIASVTRPEFLVSIKKAAAIVTDEGGLLSHAAIVSREMNKPCIIGTKIATKTFKDGDLVEVDANKGIVKVIRRK